MVNCREFAVEVKGQSLTCLLAGTEGIVRPSGDAAQLAADRTSTLKSEPYSITPRMFIDAGHRALSFDLPCHGDRALPGQPRGIAGFFAEWRRGKDVFTGFVDEGRAVVDALIRRNLAEPGHIYVSGTSRGGYCALRLMAADERVRAAAAFSPGDRLARAKGVRGSQGCPRVRGFGVNAFCRSIDRTRCLDGNREL